MGNLRKLLALGLLMMFTGLGSAWTNLAAQETGERKVKSKVQPQYPVLARRMRLTGTVKVEVVIAPDGKVKSTRVIGGNPVLIDPAVDAVKQWRFEPGPKETIQIVQFKFIRSEDER